MRTLVFLWAVLSLLTLTGSLSVGTSLKIESTKLRRTYVNTKPTHMYFENQANDDQMVSNAPLVARIYTCIRSTVLSARQRLSSILESIQNSAYDLVSNVFAHFSSPAELARRSAQQNQALATVGFLDSIERVRLDRHCRLSRCASQSVCSVTKEGLLVPKNTPSAASLSQKRSAGSNCAFGYI